MRELIKAGADVRYQREHGYNALIDALHGRIIARDAQLLDLLKLLISHRVDLSAVTSYAESALRVLSRVGRFDAVQLLIDAGADYSQLEWTPLIRAVALGTLNDVKDALSKAPVLEERDWWERTAWLVSLLSGDIAKAMLLRDVGVDVDARGRCNAPPLFYAIKSFHPEMLRWLIDEGADVHATDEFGTTSLIEAIQMDDPQVVEILLDAGADVHANANGTALSRAALREIVMRLLSAGADPADADQRVILNLDMSAEEALSTITPKMFRSACARTFGVKNPTKLSSSFWEAMVRCGGSAYEARSYFNEYPEALPQAVWSAQRFGQSLTLLPDGRAIQVGGEHEDYYDPDFCIYNDVIVHEGDGRITIYGYAESDFPPTDFHTATLVGEHIYLIGSLGYAGTRRFGETPVYQLDTRNFRMKHLQTMGDGPGWIYKHRSVSVPSQGIRVWGGTIATQDKRAESHMPNTDVFVLNLERLCWHREPVTIDRHRMS